MFSFVYLDWSASKFFICDVPVWANAEKTLRICALCSLFQQSSNPICQPHVGQMILRSAAVASAVPYLQPDALPGTNSHAFPEDNFLQSPATVTHCLLTSTHSKLGWPVWSQNQTLVLWYSRRSLYLLIHTDRHSCPINFYTILLFSQNTLLIVFF